VNVTACECNDDDRTRGVEIMNKVIFLMKRQYTVVHCRVRHPKAFEAGTLVNGILDDSGTESTADLILRCCQVRFPRCWQLVLSVSLSLSVCVSLSLSLYISLSLSPSPDGTPVPCFFLLLLRLRIILM
jgi:hypothetical protein